MQVNWVEVMGTMYKPSCILLLCFQCDVPVFGKIKEIYNIDREFYVAVQMLSTEVFNKHFHSYEVKSTSSVYVCPISSVKDYHPLWCYQCFSEELYGTTFIPLKYHIINWLNQQLLLCTCECLKWCGKPRLTINSVTMYDIVYVYLRCETLCLRLQYNCYV